MSIEIVHRGQSSYDKALVPYGLRCAIPEQLSSSEPVFDSLAQICFTALRAAEIGKMIDPKQLLPIDRPFSLRQETDLSIQAPRLVDRRLSSRFSRILDQNIKRYLEGDLSKKHYLQDLQFSLISPERICHPKIKGYSLLGRESWALEEIRNKKGSTKRNLYSPLQKVLMAEQMQRVIDEAGLAITLPDYRLIRMPGISNPESLDHQYIVAIRNICLPSVEESIKNFEALPIEQKNRLASDLCRLVVKTGFANFHPKNIRFHHGRIYILSTDPYGLMVDKADNHPSSRVEIEQSAQIGLQMIIDWFDIRLQHIKLAASRVKQELFEKGLFTPKNIQAFYQFKQIMESKATKRHKYTAYKKLPKKIRDFLDFLAWKGAGSPLGELHYGKYLIREDVSVLCRLHNKEGMPILDQVSLCITLKAIQEILQTIKKALVTDQVNPKHFKYIVNLAVRELSTHSLLNCIGKVLDKYLQDAPEDPRAFYLFCKALFFSRIKNHSLCLLDQWLTALDQVNFDLNFKNIQRRLKEVEEEDPVPFERTSREAILPTRFLDSGLVSQDQVKGRLNLLIVAYECAQVGLKYGGLGPAVWGMAQSLKARGHNVTLLLPKFSQLPEQVTKDIAPIDAVKHVWQGHTKKDRVYSNGDTGGVKVLYLEDTPQGDPHRDHFAITSPSTIYEDGILADPREKWMGLKERMLYFSNIVSNFILKNKNKFDVALYNDWHGAYAIYQQKMKKQPGKLPASVFVIHNNNFGCQGVYSGKAASLLRHIGDERQSVNIMRDAVYFADQVVAVSPTFALEMQGEILDAGIGHWVRQIAYENRFSGIANGSNPDLWDPANNPVLKKWVDPETNEAVDLTYSADDEEICAKKQQIRQQLQKALTTYYPEVAEQFDVTKEEVLLFVGRYDASQKGLEMLLPMYEQARVLGASFITMGVGEDAEATKILDLLEAEAQKHGHAWITRGKSDNASLKMQMGDPQKGIPPLGPLIRAIATLTIVPSKFEPCGLVQYESWLFGNLVIVCETGGLADTVIGDPASPAFNGFTFPRMRDWNSEEQAQAAKEAVVKALLFWRKTSEEGRSLLAQRMMRQAQMSSWITAPDGQIAPVDQYSIILAAANRPKEKQRKLQAVDLYKKNNLIDAPMEPILDDFTPKSIYQSFGAQVIQDGVRFTMLAPRAIKVELVLKWKDREQLIPMTPKNGIWSIAVPGVKEGAIYEYEITTLNGQILRKIDPFAFGFELRPLCSSIVRNPFIHEWGDGEWMTTRSIDADKDKPLNIYEVHLGTWKKKNGQCMNYREYAPLLADHCKRMGFTHLELMGIFEHPADESWGYQVKGYFAPTSRYGSIEDFQYMVDYLHQQGIGVLLDAVYYHFATDKEALSAFDGTAFFEVNHGFSRIARDGWGTRVFDHSREDVRKFLLASARFFLEALHIDGMRVDAASALISNRRHFTIDWDSNKDGTLWNRGGIQFLKELNTMIKEDFPGVLSISENSDSGPITLSDTLPVAKGGLWFDRRWNMGWMNFILGYMPETSARKVERFDELVGYFNHDLGQRTLSAFSHDETAHGKGSLISRMKGSKNHKFQQYKMWLGLEAFYPSDGRLLFMGGEFGQTKEWNLNIGMDWGDLDKPMHRSILKTTQAINQLYLQQEAFWTSSGRPRRFEWVDVRKDHAVIAYHRMSKTGKKFVVIHNFSKKAFSKFNVHFRNQKGVAKLKAMREVLNTNAKALGGSGRFINKKVVLLNHPTGFQIKLPPYATIVLEELEAS